MAHGFSLQGGLGAGGSVIPHDSSAHSVLVPDTELLFTAQFHRAGPDLVLTGRDGAHHLVPGYFSSEHHPALVAPNGAHLSSDTVDLLAGSAMPGHYAQAQPTAPPDSIGKIEKVVGDVTVVRNGVSVALHVGDAVFKSDVVATGSSSSCGISFPDGTALNLVANTRMALNDYAFDANSNSNGALFTLVEGTFAFVAGKVAHQGDMKIATPVATMGIRGTTGVVQEQPNAPATVTATAADHTYGFAVVPDIGTGITGVWDCYLTDAQGNIVRDSNGNPIVLATVSQSGFVTFLTPQGPGERPLVSVQPVTNSQYAFEQEMLSDLFRTLNPANLNNNNNGGSSTQPPPFELPNPIPQLFEDSGKPFTINFTNAANTPTPTVVDIVVGPTGPLTVVIWTASASGSWSSGPNWLGGEPPTSPQEVEILNPVKVTTDGADSAAGLVVAAGATLNIVSGTSFTIYDFIQGGGTIQLNGTGSDPTLFVHGTVSLVGGGTIKMLGPAGGDNILGVPGTGALLLNIDYTIEGAGTIGGGDGNLTFENFGTVNANDGLLTINTGNQVYNDGLMEATADPVAGTAGTLAIKDSIANAGTVQADGAGAAVSISGATFDNLFSVVAKNGGTVTFINVAVTNEAVSATDPAGGTINANGGTITFDGGSIANGNLLEATNGGTLQLENLTVTNSAAGELSIDARSELDLMGATVIGGSDTNLGNVVVTDGASVLHGDSVTNFGTMTVEAGASLTLEGDTTLINEAGGLIKADGGTVAIELDTPANVNSGTIEAVNGGEVDFYVNVDGGSNHGLIEAGAGGTVHFFQNAHGGGGGGPQGGNYGTMEAADGGVLIFDGGIDNFDLVGAFNGGLVYLNNGIKNHAGTVDAAGSGSQISISGGGNQSENAAQILAEHDGVISLTSVVLKNDAGATIDAASGGSISWITGGIDNFGTFSAGNNGTITFAGVDFTNESSGSIDAASGGAIIFTFNILGTSSVTNDGGMIEATQGGTITFEELLGGIVNENGGVIEAGTCGTITISGLTSVANLGGMIEAIGTDATVDLDGAIINDGTIKTSDGGLIEASNYVFFSNVTVADGSVIDIKDGTSLLGLGGTTTIDGTVTFEGGGEVFNTTGSQITGGSHGGTLINETTIAGVGTIGGNDLVLDNRSTGTIDAGDDGGTLTIHTGNTVTNAGTLQATNGGALQIDDAVTNSNMIEAHDLGSAIVLAGGGSNSGTITASGGGAITIDNNNNTSVFNSNMIVAGAGGTITINNTGDSGIWNSGTIEALTGGTLNIYDRNDDYIKNTGTIEADGGTINITHDHSSVINENLVEAIDGGTINITNINNGDISGGGNAGTQKADGGTINVHGGAANLSGGTIEAINGGTFDIFNGGLNNAGGTAEAGSGGTFDINGGLNNASGAKVEALAGGTVNIDGGTVQNFGLIEALSGGIVTFDDGATLHNSGGATIAALCGGTVNLNGTTVYNRNGSIEADGIGAMILLAGATIVGGTLETSAHGIIETVADSGNTTFDGVTIAAGSNVQVSDDTTLTLQDRFDCNATVTNDGTITLGQCDAGIIVNGNITLAGGGTVVLSGDTDSIVGAGKGTNTLHNANTIEGSGTIGGDDLVFINQACGIVDADACGHTLVLATGYTVHNAGLLEATSGGRLEIDDNVCNTACGVISASGHDSVVQLHDVTITGGTLETSCGGLIEVVCGSDTTIECATIACSTDVQVDSAATLTLSGVTDHGGSIDGTDASGCIVASTIDVTGDSTFCGVHLSGGDLTVESNVTLTLSGDRVSDVAITGTDASGCIVASTIDVTGDSTFCDVSLTGGNLTVESAHTLTLDNTTLDDVTVTLAYDNYTHFGADLQVDGTLTLDDATITGQFGIIHSDCGTIDVIGSSEIDNTSLSLGQVNVESNQTLTLDNAVLDSDTVTLLSAVVHDHDVGANLRVEDTLFLVNATINGSGTIDNCGTIDVQGDGSQSEIDGVTIANHGSLQIDGGATLVLNDVAVHGGSIDGTDASGCIVASTIDVTGDSTFGDLAVEKGNLTIDDSAALKIADDTTVTFDGVHVTDNGALDVGVSSGAILALDGDTGISGCGTMTINANSTLDVNCGTTTIDLGGSITNNGTLEASNGGTLDIVSHVDNSSGTLEADSGGKLDVESAICGGTATIHGGTLEFDKSSNVNVTFCNGSVDSPTYGTLVLGDPKDFHGTITGFDGTAAGSSTSDTVELKGFCATSYSVQCCDGNEILTLHDGDRCVTLTFDDFNQSFKIEDVGGNTYIYDPPATGSKDAPSTTTATTTTTPTTTTTSAGSDHTAVPADQNGSGTDHAVTSAPGTPPTLAENSFGASGNDSFTFHPNLGGNPAQNTDAHTSEIGHNNGQITAPALAPIAPEFHQEFAFDALHQDLANLAATVDQFHQMASNSTLLH
jgi:fibronectin-binding autotransporter adhesin